MNIRITSTNLVAVSPGETYGPKRNGCWSLAWVLEGGGRTTVSGRSFSTSPDCVFLVRLGQVLRHNWRRSGPSLQSFILFDMAGGPADWPLFRRLPEEALSFHLWSCLYAGRGTTREEMLKLLLELFRKGTDFPVPPRPAAPLPPAVEAALAWLSGGLEKDPAAKPGLGDLAAAVGASPQHLCRLFKGSLGASPMNCLHAMKMERASAQLERSSLNLAEIADALGYSSPYHLSATFKRFWGMSPAFYRRAFREGRRVRPASLMLRRHPLRRYAFDARWRMQP